MLKPKRKSKSETRNLKSGKKLQTRIKNIASEKKPKIPLGVLSGKNPDVIIDFEYDDGLLFIVIENTGDDYAYDVAVRFNKKILGMQKTKNISSLQIFQSLKFLPPRKEIKILVDLFQFYLAGKQPLLISASIFFRNKKKQMFQNLIQHDLSIYKDIAAIYHVKKTI
ncbi:MAG: hypothetical protein OER82_05965 [Nitrosopumilus sp.]|nr:hypothetical protein [Nitrosopumilus sp.]MDH3765338.1 hypothetical protein [Nitrosopumilus sp.]